MREETEFNIPQVLTRLSSSVEELGLALPPEAPDKLIIMLQMLLEWNERLNLTAIRNPMQAVTLHFIDSLSCLVFDSVWKAGSSVIDVGTGAGFPGIPLLVAKPSLKVTLLDSLAKRLDFVKEVCVVLGLDARCIHSRAEDAGRKPILREAFDIGVSRAVAKLAVLAEYCLPLVKVGGSFLAMKGPSVDEELAEGLRAAKVLGAILVEDRELSLPDGESRRLLLFEKFKKTPMEFPRKPGVPSRQPILP